MSEAWRLRAARTRSPLSWPQVRSIRRLVEAGHTQDSIAASFGVTRKSISDIARNRTWHDPEWVRRPLVRYCKLASCGERFETTHAAQVYCRRQHYFEARPGRLAQLMLDRLGPVVGYSPDLFDEVEVRRLRRIVGDLSEQDVAAMPAERVDVLRDRLRAEGFAP